MKRFVFTKSRLIGFCCCVLLPIVTISLGILMLVNDVMLNIGVTIVYFLIPLIAAGLLACCIFSNCKTWKKFVLTGVILVLFLMTFFISSLLVGWTQLKRYEGNKAVQRYSTLESASGLMPDLAELGKPVKIEFYNLKSFAFIFLDETDGLICTYTQEDYELQKAKLDTVYKFQTERTTDGFEPMIEIDGCQFQMLSSKEYDLYYPKNMVLIGCSDDANEIVYLEFHNTDLDYITSLQDFIMNICGWKYIR